MGIYDRDWWRERHSKKADSRSRGGGTQTRQPIETKASWPRALLVLGLIVGAGYLLHRYSPRPGLAPTQRVGQLPAVPMLCADPFPASGAVVSDGEGWKNAAHRAETLLDNQTPLHVVVTMHLNGAPFANVAVPASSQTRLSIPMGSFKWRITAGTKWCGSRWSFSDARVTNVNGSLDLVPGRRLSVRLAPQGESFLINLDSHPM